MATDILVEQMLAHFGPLPSPELGITEFSGTAFDMMHAGSPAFRGLAFRAASRRIGAIIGAAGKPGSHRGGKDKGK